jgi:hypothetical protein
MSKGTLILRCWLRQNPFCPTNSLPQRSNLDGDHDGGGQEANRQQEPVLLQLGQCDQRDHKGRHDVTEWDRNEHRAAGQKSHKDADEAMAAWASAGGPSSQYIPAPVSPFVLKRRGAASAKGGQQSGAGMSGKPDCTR